MAKSIEEGEEKKKIGAFDEVLIHIGEFGSYQRRLFMVLCIPGMICAMHKLVWVFLGAYAEHRCMLPGEHAHNASYSLPEELLNSSLPWREARGAWSRCERLLQDHEKVEGVFSDVTACEDFVFDTSVYSSSAVFEFGLVCDWEWARGAVNSALVLGGLTGALIFGNLSDRFGRRPVLLCALTLQVCAGVMASLAPSYWSFVVARYALGATVPGVYITSCVIGMELVGPSRRQYASITMQIFFSLGYLMTALLAFLVPQWRHLQLIVSLPGIVCLACWWLIPESPRWLMGQGRVSEASSVLRAVDLKNQAASTEQDSESRGALLDKLLLAVSDTLQTNTSRQTHRSTLFHLVLNYPRLRIRALIILIVWFVNGVSYFGLSWNTSDLAGNDFLNFSVSGLVEIPAHALVLLVLEWKGRVLMQSGAMLVAAVALALTAVIPQELPWLVTSLAMVGKMAVTASYGTAYILSAEIFPTCVRNAGMGACSTLAALGAIAASFIMLLSSVWSRLPYAVLSCAALVAGLLASRLPETLGRNLPESLEDGENFDCSSNKQCKNVDKIIDVQT